MRTLQPHLIIQKALKRRQKENSKFSLRSLAKKVRVSPGYLSKVISGQKSLTKDLIVELGFHLKMDSLQLLELHESFEHKVLREKVGDAKLPHRLKKAKVLDEYELATSETEWILSKWFYIAVMDLFTCENVSEDPAWLSQKLQISVIDARDALKNLELKGLLIRDENNRLQKKYKKIRFPTRISKELVRTFHISQMKRAIRLLEFKHQKEDFDLRLITGITVATNMQNFEKVKNFLHKALYEAADLLCEGECTDLYQLNLQIFPQTVVEK